MGTVFKKNGKYLKYVERTPGSLYTAQWVDDLQDCTVFREILPSSLRNSKELLRGAEKLTATEARVVSLCSEQDRTSNQIDLYEALRDAYDFFGSYSTCNENAQSRMKNEVDAMLEKMKMALINS